MKIAIPVWNGFVSSVFDFAHKILLVEIQNGRELNRSEVPLQAESLPQRAGRLKQLNVNAIICGAISRPLMYMLTASGVEVLPYVTGRVDEILQAYITGRLGQQQFILPGCWPGARKGFGRGRRGPPGQRLVRRAGCRWRGGRRRF
jgi:predicted Fe-Mo cluster-binding NifX family protein